MAPNPTNLRFQETLRDFKEVYCDENRLIADALRSSFSKWLTPPVLDVGAGLGDIAAHAFTDIEAVLLDVNDIPESKNFRHTRVTADFFDYEPANKNMPRTLLLIHVLQYLDDNLIRLRDKITALDPKVIITVVNDNTGAFGTIMSWSLAEIAQANPEVRCDLGPRYRLVQTVPITATLRCPTFSLLARHFVEVLLDAASLPKSISKMQRRLEQLLKSPEITIDQTVYCYEKI
jgi:hypothetical protein